MLSSRELDAARKLYDEGLALFQEQRYSQALAALQKAEDAYRAIDSRGHPFNVTLPNGITGLANTLALEGRCFQESGDFDRALTYYELSLINEKFERRSPFRKFLQELHMNMKLCYEHRIKGLSEGTISALLARPVEVNASYRFPFSLDQERIPLARLYEIDPGRYGRFRAFYQAAHKQDSDIRLKDHRSGEYTTRRMGVFIWSILFAIWSVYIVIFIRIVAF